MIKILYWCLGVAHHVAPVAKVVAPIAHAPVIAHAAPYLAAPAYHGLLH